MMKLAISRCLTGDAVRYDGTGKYHPYLCEVLAHHFELTPICPEAEIGMGIPRPPIHLIKQDNGIRALRVEDHSQDFTNLLSQHIYTLQPILNEVSGYIFKARSPSCGMSSTPIIDKVGNTEFGAGIFAQQVVKHYPHLPVIEEEALGDPEQRDHFIERLFAYHDCQSLITNKLTKEVLNVFIETLHLTLIARNETFFVQIKNSLNKTNSDELQKVTDQLLKYLKQPISRKGHCRALRYCSNQLPSDDVREIENAINTYQKGKVCIDVPLQCLRKQFEKHDNHDFMKQRYLFPSEIEWQLRFPK